MPIVRRYAEVWDSYLSVYVWIESLEQSDWWTQGLSISTPWVVGVMEALRYLPCLPVKYLGPMRISELIAVRLPNSQLLGPHQNWNHPLLKWGHSLGRAHYHALSVSPRDINFESTSTPNAMTSKSHGVKDSMARLLGRKIAPTGKSCSDTTREC